MKHRKKTFKIGHDLAQKKAVMANMACSLIEEGQIRTTLRRAKEMRRLAERAITLGKRGTLHARRQAISKLRRPDVVHYLFSNVAPAYMDRNGGYTRLIKLGPRKGDAAEMCLVQLVEGSVASANAGEEGTDEAEASAPES